MNTALRRKGPYLEVLFLVLISALVYLPYASRLTYYLDDWYYIYNGVVAGPNIFHSMFSIDRPARGYFFDVYFSLFGPIPFPYHLGAYLWRLIAGLCAFRLFRTVWPDDRRLVFFSALLFILYPGYFWWISAIEYQPMIASLALQVFSFVMTLEAIKTSRISLKVIFLFNAILSGWAYLALVEYAIGMELFRFLCVYLIVSQKEEYLPILKKLFVSIKAWAWNALIPAGFIFWRLFLFENHRKATDINLLLSKLKAAPVDTLWEWSVNLFESVSNAGFYAWFKQFYLRFADGGFKIFGMDGVIVVIGISALLAAAAYSLGDSHSIVINKGLKKNANEAIFLGLASLLAGLLPVVFANRYVNLNFSSHYGLPASLGAATLLVGLVSYLLSSRRIYFVVISVFIVLAASTHMLIAKKTIALENSLQNFWWQANWRIPGLRPDATLVTLYPSNEVVDYDLGLVEPANLIYFPDSQSQIPIRYPVSTLMPNNNNINIILALKTSKMVKYRVMKLVINYDNILILVQPTSHSCVRVIDGENSVFSEDDPENIRKIYTFSKIENIRLHVDYRTPPEFAFGPEPDHEWCYFFEKADLAVQKHNWEEASMLGDEVLALGLYPSDPVEWFPFIQAYAITGSEDKLDLIAMRTKTNESFERQVCEAFRRPGSVLGPGMRTGKVIEGLFCD